MTLMTALLSEVRSRWVSPAEVRAEAWALGARHQGEPLQGARIELKAAGISAERSVLLKAVIRSLRRAKR